MKKLTIHRLAIVAAIAIGLAATAAAGIDAPGTSRPFGVPLAASVAALALLGGALALAARRGGQKAGR